MKRIKLFAAFLVLATVVFASAFTAKTATAFKLTSATYDSQNDRYTIQVVSTSTAGDCVNDQWSCDIDFDPSNAGVVSVVTPGAQYVLTGTYYLASLNEDDDKIFVPEP